MKELKTMKKEDIKQTTIMSNNKELFDNMCNKARIEFNVIAEQTTMLWAREEIIYVAVLFYAQNQ